MNPQQRKPTFSEATWRDLIQGANQGVEDAYRRRERIFREAEKAGLSRRQIAIAAGLSAQAISKILGSAKALDLDDPARLPLEKLR